MPQLGNMEIELTKGHKAIIDDEDCGLVSKYKWQARVSPRNVYARHTLRENGKPKRTLDMHRLIMNAPENSQVDHINGNGLDNRKTNLRICKKSDNAKNATKRIDNKSGYKGVYKFQNKWRAMIGVNNKRVHLGMFEDKVDAAKAYDEAAAKYFGEFARKNFT